jgi:hypothetical protein
MASIAAARKRGCALQAAFDLAPAIRHADQIKVDRLTGAA